MTPTTRPFYINLLLAFTVSACLAVAAVGAGCSGVSSTAPTGPGLIPTGTPAPTPYPTIEDRVIDASAVTFISINTVYTGFFDTNDRCAKTYNEYFGNEDGIGSSSSPCTAEVTFERSGTATRSIAISRWDKTAKSKKVVESTKDVGKISGSDFDQLADAITQNAAFKAWREGTMINVSNCSINVKYPGGSKSVMSNAGPTATDFMPMVDAVKKAEKSVAWKPSI